VGHPSAHHPVGLAWPSATSSLAGPGPWRGASALQQRSPRAGLARRRGFPRGTEGFGVDVVADQA
jgi:hypothetical protein